MEGVRAFRSRLLRWGEDHRRSFPWRETDDPFRILIAEVLLQRSRGKTVATVYERLFARWPTAEALARARVDSIGSVDPTARIGQTGGDFEGAREDRR